MQAYWTLTRRELGAYFMSLTGYIIIAAVTFLDPRQGWLVLTGQGADGSPSYILAQTADGGSTWTQASLSLFQPNDPAAYGAKVYLQFIQLNRLWLNYHE